MNRRATSQTGYAIALLKRDHQIVDELFTEFGTAAPEQEVPLTRRICKLLIIHMRIKERFLYPLAKEVLKDKGAILAAEKANSRTRELINKLTAMAPKDPSRRSVMLELSENVRAHQIEEERQLFPRLENASVDLDHLGRQLDSYKSTLMQEEGLHEDDELNVRSAR